MAWPFGESFSVIREKWERLKAVMAIVFVSESAVLLYL